MHQHEHFQTSETSTPASDTKTHLYHWGKNSPAVAIGTVAVFRHCPLAAPSSNCKTQVLEHFRKSSALFQWQINRQYNKNLRVNCIAGWVSLHESITLRKGHVKELWTYNTTVLHTSHMLSLDISEFKWIMFFLTEMAASEFNEDGDFTTGLC